jgi:UDP-N-acetylmuramoyl-tripeptide--D-alanyl-D-alanine ligase
MEPRSLKYVAAACGGQCSDGPEAVVRRVCTDSRQAQPGDLFIALAGERFDGHAFLSEVAERGVEAVMAETERIPPGFKTCPVIRVGNTREALRRLAARYRQDFTLPVIVVGGSNGKTTTKELLASVLKQRFDTLWSEASFNNNIGVPLTLLRLENRHQAAVLEVGTNHPGELEPLLKMIQPRHGLITCIGREHLEFFGTVAAVAQEEGAVAEILPKDGKLFMNGDTACVEEVLRRSQAPAVRIGFSAGNDWRATDVRVEESGVRFRVHSPGGAFDGEFRVQLLGRHQALNALLALAAGAELGVRKEEAARGLAECPPAKLRMQAWEMGGVRLLEDTYNANADSMLAALETLRDLPATRRIAVLGDMAELGIETASAHAEAGRLAAELRIDLLIAAGKNAAITARAARTAGLAEVMETGGALEAAEALGAVIKPGDLVLLKASRTARFERIAELLKELKLKHAK